MKSENLYFQNLGNRCLWVDGDTTLTKEGIYDLILSGEDLIDIKVSHIDEEIKRFSKLTDIEVSEKTKPDYSKIDDTFNIPEYYRTINLGEYFLSKLKSRVDKVERHHLIRVKDELDKFQEKGMEDVLRLAIYIVDTMKEAKIVWGPGRGSACCSFLFYLIELHDIDSVKFELDINEFLR